MSDEDPKVTAVRNAAVECASVMMKYARDCDIDAADFIINTCALMLGCVPGASPQACARAVVLAMRGNEALQREQREREAIRSAVESAKPNGGRDVN